MTHVQGVSYVGGAYATAIKHTTPHLKELGYNPQSFLQAMEEAFAGMGIGAHDRFAVRNESRQATDLGSQQVGAEQNSGRGFLA
jgi:hypothetical protein